MGSKFLGDIPMFNLLENDYKTELVCNTMSTFGEGLGFGETRAVDLINSPAAAVVTISTNGTASKPGFDSRSWKPDRLITKYTTDDLEVTETKAGYRDIILSKITIKSNLPSPVFVNIKLESFNFSPDLEFTANLKDNGYSLDYDNGYSFRFMTSINPIDRKLHGAFELRKVEWVTEEIRKLLGDIPVKYSYTAELYDVAKSYNPLRGHKAYVQQNIPMFLCPGELREIVFGIEFSKESQLREAILEPDGFFRESAENWSEFQKSLPVFECSNQKMVQDFYFGFYVLKSNQVELDLPHLPTPGTVVSKFFYFHHFFWDSAFHSIAWSWCNDPKYAQNEARISPSHQWGCGLIPQESFLFHDVFHWGTDTSNWATTAPANPITSMEIYKRYGCNEFLKFIYERMLKYSEWLDRYLDIDKDGLVAWRHVWETSWDDNQRWTGITRGNLFDKWVESVDFNSLIYRTRQFLLDAGTLLNILDIGTEEEIKKTNLKMKAAFDLFWDEEDGFYYDLIDYDHKKIRVKASTSFYPFTTDLMPADRKKRVLEHLLNPNEFNTPCPIPTTSADHPLYDPSFTIRGATFASVTWTILQGLYEHGEKEAVGGLLSKFLNKSSVENPKLQSEEYYNSQTGVAGCALRHYGCGALFIDFLIRFVIGIHPQVGNKIVFDPVDIGLDRYKISNIQYKGNEISVEWDKQKGYGVRVNGSLVMDMKEPSKVKVEL